MISLLPRLLAHTPNVVKRQALIYLFEATATAFACEMPRLHRLSHEQCLLAYARFSATQAAEALRGGDDLPVLQGRLYQNAYRLGRMPGWLLRVRRVEDVMVLGRFLYSILDIDFHGNSSGEITIGRCYFNSFYSPQVCQLMSAMDHGLLAGLAGGAGLAFTQRITEGRPCCRARLTLAGGPSSTGG
jgi:hypothetical protein